MNVIIVKTNGERYETPESNLENVKRLIKYTDIIYPGEEGYENNEEESPAAETRTKLEVKPKVAPKGKKPIKS